ncbi:hypothetical protein [cyanobacterium endosymbiont of Epithemia turgida]|nr:hypothetical protein [cyanobacterium endosymbiont of Epithemia turgida]
MKRAIAKISNQKQFVVTLENIFSTWVGSSESMTRLLNACVF